MKKLIALLLISTQAFAGLPPTSIKGQTDANPKTKFQFQAPHNQVTDLGGIKALIETGSSNILPDPGFEAVTSGWTASGGATATTNSTAKGTGALGYDWDSNSASQTLQSTSVTIPAGLQGKNGVASCQIKTVSGTATHTLTVNDGTNDLATPLTIGSNTTAFQETKINFVFPTSGTIRLKLASVASNEPEIYIDDCKISLADNIYDVQQAKLIDVVTVTGCASTWTTTSATYANFGTQTGCTYTSKNNICTAPATNVPGVKCSTLSGGDYRLEYEGRVGENSGGISAWFRFNDGTNSSREESAIGSGAAGHVAASTGISHSISYSAPQSNVTLQVQGKTNGGTAAIYGTTASPATFKVWYFPSASQQAVSSAQGDYDWTSYTPTLTGVGTATNVSFRHSRVGPDLLIKGTFTAGTVSANLASVTLPSGLSIDTSKTTLNVATGNAGPVAGKWSGGTTADHFGPIVLATSTNAGLLYFGYNSSSTSLNQFNGNFAFSTGEVISLEARVPIVGWSSNQRAPTLVGSVTTDNDTPERICRATVTASCTSSPCTIANGNAGSCMTNITRSSAGVYTANFPSGKFSAVPSCFAWNYTTNRYMIGNGTGTATAFSFQTSDSADTGFTVMCMGPR